MAKLAFIGSGNMAEALLKGLLSKKVYPARQIICCDVNRERLNLLTKKYGVLTRLKPAEAIEESDNVILSVKPQQMGELLTAHKESFSPKQLILTIAAGLPLKFYQKILGRDKKIIRVMPNTPAMVNQGVSGFIATKNCPDKDKKTALTILKSVGLAFEVKNEGQIDGVTAISGSGPAYVYLFAQALIRAARGLKLPESREMVIQTILGAAKLLEQSGEETESLIQKVASKGGTTEAALQSFQRDHFEKIVEAAVLKAHGRSSELAKILLEG